MAAQIVIVAMNNELSAQNSANELALLPLQVQSLVPVTRQTIWRAGCRMSLNDDQVEEWRAIIATFTRDRSVVFNDSLVRVGIRLSTATYFVDQKYVLLDALEDVATPRDRDARAEFSQLVDIYHRVCTGGRLERMQRSR